MEHFYVAEVEKEKGRILLISGTSAIHAELLKKKLYIIKQLPHRVELR
jgi:hypothetical protein